MNHVNKNNLIKHDLHAESIVLLVNTVSMAISTKYINRSMVGHVVVYVDSLTPSKEQMAVTCA